MTLTDVFTYCHGIDWPDGAPTRPWRQNGWLWATQGFLLVASRDDGSPADEAPARLTKAEKYLGAEPTDAQPVDLLALSRFAGEAPQKDIDCEACGGSGYDDGADLTKCEHCHQHTRLACLECGGDGRDEPRMREGVVRGIPINLLHLAYGLSCVPLDGPAQIGTLVFDKNQQHQRALMVFADNWRVVVMSLRDTTKGAPVFAPELSATV